MKVIVFTIGDSNLAKTWSNVPYFFTSQLEKMENINLTRINIDPFYNAKIIEKINLKIVKYYTAIIRMIFKGNDTYDVTRTMYYDYLVNKKIKHALHHNNADAIIFMNFSFSGYKFFQKTKILICDWTIDYLIEKLQHRKPRIF